MVYVRALLAWYTNVQFEKFIIHDKGPFAMTCVRDILAWHIVCNSYKVCYDTFDDPY